MEIRCSLSLVPNFADLELRLYNKFDISRSDARLAVKYLCCFFDARVRNITETIILPQIADWAWHELILDTRRYRQFCMAYFGKLLSHVKEDIENPKRNLRSEFVNSMYIMQSTYGLGLGENPEAWMEAGWDKPRYRLRNPIEDRSNSTLCSVNALIFESNEVSQRILEWLPSRLVQRFGISELSARLGVIEHINQFFSIGAGSLQSKRSVISEIAWEEHILWTERYSEDCIQLLGYFLDHTPGPILPVQRENKVSASLV